MPWDMGVYIYILIFLDMFKFSQLIMVYFLKKKEWSEKVI